MQTVVEHLQGKVWNVKEMKHHFKENSKTHIMKTKNSELFEVTFAHKVRVQNSPIIYIKKLLN